MDTGTGAIPTRTDEPGWYPDGSGSWWWWDGRAWTAGPVAGDAGRVAGSGGAGGSGNGAVMWVLGLLLGLIGSAVGWAISSPRTLDRHHARECLNLQLVLLVLSVPSFVLMIVGIGWWFEAVDLSSTAGTAAREAQVDEAMGRLALVTFGSMVVSLPVTAYSWYVHIKGAIAAGRGEVWWAPLPFRAVKPAAGEPVRPRRGD